MTAPETPAAKLARLWKAAQGPRDPRSSAYMRGVRDGLSWKAAGSPKGALSNPFAAGTAESDAWFSGLDEGKRSWEWDTEKLRPFCDQCGNYFDPPNRPQGGGTTQLYCSTRCRVAAHRSEKKAPTLHKTAGTEPATQL